MSAWGALIQRLRYWSYRVPARPGDPMREAADAMEALMSDEAIERAARTITPELYYHYDEWDDATGEDRARALKMACAALAAAIGDDDE